jgi:hypothetical protein
MILQRRCVVFGFVSAALVTGMHDVSFRIMTSPWVLSTRQCIRMTLLLCSGMIGACIMAHGCQQHGMLHSAHACCYFIMHGCYHA